MRGGLRLTPAQVGHGRGRKGNSPEDSDGRCTGLGHTLELAALDRDDRVARGLLIAQRRWPAVLLGNPSNDIAHRRDPICLSVSG